MLKVELRDRKDGPVKRWPSIMEKDAFAISEALKTIKSVPKLNLATLDGKSTNQQDELQESIFEGSKLFTSNFNSQAQNRRSVKLRSEPRILSPSSYAIRLSSSEYVSYVVSR